jgi:hypothetical protein
MKTNATGNAIVPVAVTVASEGMLATLIADAGERASRRFIDFFTANIRNRNTREA